MYILFALASGKVGQGARVGHKLPIQQQTALPSPKLNRFNQAAFNLSEIGRNNIRVLRGWAKSKGWTQFSHPNAGGPERWGVFNITRQEYEWNLMIKPESSIRTNLHMDSAIPRFDARLERGGAGYINPFTNKIGSKDIGRHIPLNEKWW
ncbi:MAG: hypothetical protein S4CHLAM81_12060 [Chlamydiales bacterium]|nr:hypothetical protein [Chlamydiales bacterium]MCH9635982.1 hypothetical protein [Chlamydiales bacterium]MCH9703891.1 hypothetical protein [Chlamydiota bacterium]